MAQTARDYFYSVVAPEHAGHTYQTVHQHEIYQEETARHNQGEFEHLGLPVEHQREVLERIRAHVPFRSNDFLIESYMTDLLESAPATLRLRLETMFVAKLKEFDANAGALCSEGKYEGDLIFFNVGLSDACYQYAILYYEFIRLVGERQRNADELTCLRR